MAPKRKKEEKESKDEEAEEKEEKEEKEEEAEGEEDDYEDPEDDEYEEPVEKKSKKSKKKKEVEEEEEDDDDDDLEEDAAAAKKTKKKAFTVTLSRAGGSLGIAMNGNYVTAVHEGGAAATEGSIKVGDIVVEVNGKDTGLNTFAKLIPADKEKPIKMRLIRLEVVE